MNPSELLRFQVRSPVKSRDLVSEQGAHLVGETVRGAGRSALGNVPMLSYSHARAVLRLLHLSDIHFTPWVDGQPSTVDDAAREDLINDLKALGERAADVDAVLVVGDLAARGKPEEFTRAREFLEVVCKVVGCAPTRVACVPGNHDVDRDAHGVLNTGLRRLLRTEPLTRIERTRRAILSDPEAAQILHAPLTAYNDFAAPYLFPSTAGMPMPGAWDLDLDGRRVALRGVNSALVCDAQDGHKDPEDRVVLGVDQLAPLVDDVDAISVLMCHHPPNWLRDESIVMPWLKRPHLLLTGHEHQAEVRPEPDGSSVHIAAGAVSPEVDGGLWQPSYNVLDLAVDDGTLVVSVTARTYAPKRARFGAPAGLDDPQVVRITLDPSVRPTGSAAPPDPPRPVPRATQTSDRDLMFAILDAPADARERAARELDLLARGDRLLSDEHDRALLDLARDRGLLKRLLQAVEEEMA